MIISFSPQNPAPLTAAGYKVATCAIYLLILTISITVPMVAPPIITKADNVSNKSIVKVFNG